MKKKFSAILFTLAMLASNVANIGCIWAWCEEPDACDILND